jgi:hypothetical protein
VIDTAMPFESTTDVWLFPLSGNEFTTHQTFCDVLFRDPASCHNPVGSILKDAFDPSKMSTE